MAGVLETLLHFDGTSGAIGCVDATGRHRWTCAGGAVIDQSQAKFASSSVNFTSVNGLVQYTDSNVIALGTSDFTIDFWIKFYAYSRTVLIFSTLLIAIGFLTTYRGPASVFLAITMADR